MNNITAQGPAPYKNTVVTSPIIPGYPGYLLSADAAYLAGPPFFSDGLYPNLAGDVPEWPSPIETQYQLPQTTMPDETGLGITSPDSWGAETDSESYDNELFSPVTSHGSMDWEAPNPAPKRPWSEASSPCEGAGCPSPNISTSPNMSPTVDVKLRKPRASSRKAKSTSGKPAKSPTTTTSPSSSRPTKSRKSAPSSTSKSTPPQKSPAAPVPAVPAAAEADECRARRNHNLVEKQYRNRLNAQFERLLAILPDDHNGSETGGGRPLRSISSTKGKPASAFGPDDRRISKAEVLEMATTRIRELEAERRRLEHERRELLRSIERAAGADRARNIMAAGRQGVVVLPSDL